ncbi:protein MAINTENANCE OF MERISTEMS-like [Papaver somniferum]|uniref:protein MAINTENANCE OF MERISTEMS-like n=1 Tax=Papaver somniferum TaxID=3469 RepID=UPI000E703ECD|nr:protein MAINTENANCE OF MERISTEMS-like [Papaver somniferum]
MFAGTLIKEKVDGLYDAECRYAAAGYFLYTLPSVIFPDSKGNRVNVNLLQLLDPLEYVNKYSWGTAMVAYLNGQLSTATRERSSQIHGNTALLQVWIYDRFPSLIKDNPDVIINPGWNKTKPRGTRYLYTGCQDKEQKDALLESRQKLDNITVAEVVFDPYKNDRVSAMEDVVYYTGPLFYPYGFSMYNPMRIMRQLGYIQDSPVPDYEPRFKHKLDKCESNEAELVVVYEPEPKTKHWDDRHKHDSKIDISFWEHVNEGHESTTDYLEWYERFSDPRVIRIDPPGTRRSNKESSSASTSDTRDDPTILNLSRERMKILIKAFCCTAEI